MVRCSFFFHTIYILCKKKIIIYGPLEWCWVPCSSDGTGLDWMCVKYGRQRVHETNGRAGSGFATWLLVLLLALDGVFVCLQCSLCDSAGLCLRTNLKISEASVFNRVPTLRCCHCRLLLLLAALADVACWLDSGPATVLVYFIFLPLLLLAFV